MILEELVLHNFGIFRGRHAINISPAKNKPVVLIGGLNGGGKTSILDALQLALYGKLSQCSNRGNLSYEEYLTRTINRHVPIGEGAAVELQFSHTVEAQPRRYRIHRSWRQTGNGVRERVEVTRDGQLDPLLTESWDEHVDAFIPARLAPLFFFDGEKIEALAEPSSSRAVLETALNGLLGLDIVRRLEVDLLSLEKRHRTRTSAELDVVQLNTIQRELDEAEQHRLRLFQECAAARNLVAQSELDLNEANKRYQAAGGSAYEQRTRLEADFAEAKLALVQAEDDLRRTAAGPAPLLLIAALLDDVSTRAAQEHALALNGRLVVELESRDASLLASLEARGVKAPARRVVEEYLTADRAKRGVAGEPIPYLGLTESETIALQALVVDTLPEVRDTITRQLDNYESTLAQKELAERRIAAVPEAEDLALLLTSRASAAARLDEARRALASMEEQYASAQRQRDSCAARLDRLIEERSKTILGEEDSARLTSHSTRARATLATFRSELVTKHADQIQQLILSSFLTIARKQDLLSGIHIDPETFALSLADTKGIPVLPERLSAGERQLLAVSILWGLARAAKRPLPAVIDTPLGRLDSVHRERLVRDYFHRASHQVLLLSTDEEIDEALFNTLKPHVAHSYTLRYDPVAASSRVEQGYFWN